MSRTIRLFLTLLAIFLITPTSSKAHNGPDLVSLVKRLKPTVVYIMVTHKTSSKTPKKHGSMRDSPFNDDTFNNFFRHFFDRRGPRRPRDGGISAGSGVIIDDQGHVITNHHVIENGNEYTVRLSDEREFKADLVGQDPKTDLALLRIKGNIQWPVATLGDSDHEEVGSSVVAIGSPELLQFSVTAGIISAKSRAISENPYDNFIQTDAAINPGNSGGPLFNLKGEVIGINTLILRNTEGIGFAIPINLAKSVVKQLKTHGRVSRGWLGVRIQTITPELAEALGLKDKTGALVANVDPESPAEKGGLRSGDVILRFDGKKVDRMRDLPTIVAETPKGKRVHVKVLRNGRQKVLKVRIAEMEDSKETPKPVNTADTPNHLGMAVRPLTDDLRKKLKVNKKVKGVVVSEVEPDSIAHEGGLNVGDIVSEVNRKPVRKPSELRAALRDVEKGQTVLMLIHRQGDPVFLALKVR
ncbi:MAG: Do family serine endopeptidase [Magnetococcales bacterium]|nr:Do family serine endopeptidase [Magnetococcales bacterium]